VNLVTTHDKKACLCSNDAVTSISFESTRKEIIFHPCAFSFSRKNLDGFIHINKPQSLCQSFFLDNKHMSNQYNICIDFPLVEQRIDSIALCVNSNNSLTDEYIISILTSESKTKTLHKVKLSQSANSFVGMILKKRENHWFYSLYCTALKNKTFSGFIPCLIDQV